MTKLSDIIASFVGKGHKSELKSAEEVQAVQEKSQWTVGNYKIEVESVTSDETTSQEGSVQKKKFEIPKINIGSDKAPPTIEPEEEIEITDEFKEAFRLIDSRAPFVFITGRAGTGKSTFIQALKKRLKSHAIVAPTGVAALNVGGQTIHSFFRLAPGPIDFSKIQRVKNRIGYQALRAVIIDEISMVRADLMDAIDLMLRRNASSPDNPFGGVQIIAVGDLFQLPPVVSTEEEQAFLHGEYKSPFFFSAKVLKEVPLKTIEFSKIFRQKEEKFIKILNNLREGKKLSETLAAINERVESVSPDSFDGIILTGDNDRASKVNSKRLFEIDAGAVSYLGNVSGEFRVDKAKLPAPVDLTLKVRSQVMFVKNDGAKRWVNGTLGIVKELGSDYVMVNVRDGLGERTVKTEAVTWENLKFVYDADENQIKSEKVGGYTQIPLTLAWAVTIHKSQGKTFDRVHVDLSRGAFAEGQVYVALSRCRTLEGVTLEKAIEKEDIHLNYDVISFYETMGNP
jgi:hypothetical protein